MTTGENSLASLLHRAAGIEHRAGRLRFVQTLDRGGLAQAVDQLRLRTARDVIFDLALDLFEFRRRLNALVLDFDNVPAELSVYRVGNLTLVELESGFGKFRHHLVFGEP